MSSRTALLAVAGLLVTYSASAMDEAEIGEDQELVDRSAIMVPVTLLKSIGANLELKIGH